MKDAKVDAVRTQLGSYILKVGFGAFIHLTEVTNLGQCYSWIVRALLLCFD